MALQSFSSQKTMIFRDVHENPDENELFILSNHRQLPVLESMDWITGIVSYLDNGSIYCLLRFSPD